MTKDEALRKIKQLRDEISDVPDPTDPGWVNAVVYHLDRASDVIEFPDETRAYAMGAKES